MATDIADPEVQAVAWDLEPLVDGAGPAGVERQLDEADRRAAAFAERHAGRVAELDGPAFAEAIGELAAISELAGKAGSYAHLDFSIDTSDPARGALLGKVTEQGTAIETKLLFFELEWARWTTSAPTSCWPPTASRSPRTTCARCAATGRTCSPSPRRRSSPRSRRPARARGRACSPS
jgi:hypothetical protein